METDGVLRDEWLIRVQKSSRKQEAYFGNFAWMPYIRAYIPTFLSVDEILIKKIINASYQNEPLDDGIKCVKYIGLMENECFEFQYSKILKNKRTGRWWFEGFITVTL